MPVITLTWKTYDWKFPRITSEKEFLFMKKDVSLEDTKKCYLQIWDFLKSSMGR